MKRVMIALGLSAIFATAAPAKTVTLEDISLSSGQFIDVEAPGFGSEGPVTLDWDPTDDGFQSLRYWAGTYSNRNAAWCNSGVACALDLTVADGYQVSLQSVFLGGYPNTDRVIAWSVIDLLDGLEKAGANQAVDGTTGEVVPVGLTSTEGFRILFGPDGFNGGINDITYTYEATGVTPIPLPASALLLGSALAGALALRRRRSARA